MATNKDKAAEAAVAAANETAQAAVATAETKANEATAVAAAPVDDKVEIFVPKGYANDEPNLLISVNGVNYLLPKGKTSKVPKHIAEEFYRSQKAQMKLDEHIDQMLEASK